MFEHFTKCSPWVCLVLVILLYFFLWWIYSAIAPELYLRFYLYVWSSYKGFCIFMFVHVIQSNCWLYFILVILKYVFPMYGLFFHFIVIKFTFSLICLWMVYLSLLWYVCVIHTIWYLLVLHLGNFVMNISCI